MDKLTLNELIACIQRLLEVFMSALSTQEPTVRSPADPVAEMTMAASTEAASRALRAGARAPLFTLADASGNQVALENLLSEGPVVLHFSRGAWCSFGEEGFAEFAASYRDINALGACAVSIAPPSQAAARNTPLPMRELRDPDMKIAQAYGLAFDLPAGLRPDMKRSAICRRPRERPARGSCRCPPRTCWIATAPSYSPSSMWITASTSIPDHC
jgi:peroxiredoxin